MCNLYNKEPNILHNYKEFVESTKAGNLTLEQNLSLAGLGLTGEAGEVADLIKKNVFHKKPLVIDEVIKEMGDVLWYLAFLANTLNISLDYVLDANVNKLNLRYPNGFNPTDAALRLDEIEYKKVSQNLHRNDAYDSLLGALSVKNNLFGEN